MLVDLGLGLVEIHVHAAVFPKDYFQRRSRKHTKLPGVGCSSAAVRMHKLQWFQELPSPSTVVAPVFVANKNGECFGCLVHWKQ